MTTVVKKMVRVTFMIAWVSLLNEKCGYSVPFFGRTVHAYVYREMTTIRLTLETFREARRLVRCKRLMGLKSIDISYGNYDARNQSFYINRKYIHTLTATMVVRYVVSSLIFLLFAMIYRTKKPSVLVPAFCSTYHTGPQLMSTRPASSSDLVW